MNVVHLVIILAALLVARAGHAATPAWDDPAAAPANLSLGEGRRDAGKSFLDHVRTPSEEPSYSVPAIFPGSLAPPPRRKQATAAMLLASLGLMLYLGRRRQKALAAAAFP